MNVVSLVPSWTETLLGCGVQVVGRTRYCVHPRDQISSIPVLGGTKRLDWSCWSDLKADLVVLDQDENTREIAEQCPFPVFVSHVRGLQDITADCERLGEKLNNGALRHLAQRWRTAACVKPSGVAHRPLAEVPAVKRWIRRPPRSARQLIYLIWRKPWMAAGVNSFIGSVLGQLGFAWALSADTEPYPTINLDHYDPQATLLLLSSEPYPFEEHLDQVASLPFPMALVDGEAYSWYGVRSLRFLEHQLWLAYRP